MMTKRQALKYAEHMTQRHGEAWVVFKTPDDAPINQYLRSVGNTRRYFVCTEAERADYEARGAKFLKTTEED